MATTTARKTAPAKTGSHATGRRDALAAAKAKIAKATPAERPEAPKAADQLLNGVRTADRTPAPAPAPAPRRANRTSRAAAKATPAAPARGPRARMPSPAKPAPAPAPKPAPEPKAPAYTKIDARADLFQGALLALETYVEQIPEDDPIFQIYTPEEAGAAIANAVHHFAAGKGGNGKRYWPSDGEGALPKPDRSEWR